MRIAIAVACLVACSPDRIPEPPDHSCDASPDPHCTHPIDRLLVPKLRALELPIRDATGEELCRRMAIDLLGRGPLPDELAACSGKTAEEIFDAMVADRDGYARAQARLFGDLVNFEFSSAYPLDIVDLDAAVRETYRGTRSYADFVRHFAMHGAFEGHHPGDSWTSALFHIFLGRPARTDEIRGMHPLTQVWVVRALIDGSIWGAFYKFRFAVHTQAGDLNPEALAIEDANAFAVGNIRREWAINPCLCMPRPGFPGCIADVLGTRLEITGSCVDPVNPTAEINWRRVNAHTPRTDGLCPDQTTRYECSDRSIARDSDDNFLPLTQLPVAEPALKAQLDAVGDALLARGELWETAADRELRRFLGWWQNTFKHPDSDLPEVRDVLARKLRDGASLLEIQRLIMTSLLYDQPADSPDGADATTPPWAAAPTKVLYGEDWIRSMARPLGFGDPLCDHRWLAPLGPAFVGVHPQLVETNGLPIATAQLFGELMTKVGGCLADADRPDVTNIGMVFNHGDLARLGCSAGAPLAGWTDQWTGDFAAAARELIAKLWGRSERPGEVDAMVAQMSACRAEPTGCLTDAATVGWLCQRMIDSVEFGTY